MSLKKLTIADVSSISPARDPAAAVNGELFYYDGCYHMVSAGFEFPSYSIQSLWSIGSLGKPNRDASDHIVIYIANSDSVKRESTWWTKLSVIQYNMFIRFHKDLFIRISMQGLFKYYCVLQERKRFLVSKRILPETTHGPFFSKSFL